MEKLITFDMYGVLTSEKMFATNTVYPLLEDKVSYNLFKKAYLLYSLGLISRDQFWETCKIKADKIFEQEEQVIKSVTINQGAKLVLKTAKDNGWAIILASEGPRDWTEKILEANNLLQYFDSLYISSDVGHTKPYKQFFEQLPWRQNQNQQVIYVDDSKENLITASKMFSVNTVHFSYDNTEDDLDSITSLSELLKII